MRFKGRFSRNGVSCNEIFMYFTEKSQFEILFFLWCRMLCTSKTLVSLFSGSYRSCITPACYVFNPNNVLFHCICIAEFFIVSRSSGYSTLSSTFLLVFSTFSCIYSINDFIFSALFYLNVF